VTEYVVNVTTLRSFDAPFTGLGYGSEPASIGGTSLTTSTPGATIIPAPSTLAAGGTQAAATPTDSSGKNNNKGSTGIDISSEEKVEVQMRQIKV